MPLIYLWEHFFLIQKKKKKTKNSRVSNLDIIKDYFKDKD